MSMKSVTFESRERISLSDPIVAFCYGLCAEFGWGRRKNIPNAIKFYEGAANGLVAQGYYRKWICLQKLNLIAADSKLIEIDCLRSAANLGYAQAQFDLYQIGQKTYGISEQEARRWLRKAFKQKFAQAELVVASQLATSDKTKRTAHKIYLDLAHRGIAEAQFEVGEQLLIGNRASKDAISLIESAAKSDYLPALDFLAWAYSEGVHNKPKNLAKAERLRRRSQKAFQRNLDFLI